MVAKRKIELGKVYSAKVGGTFLPVRMGKEGLTMTTKQQTFGARLRAARKAAELTQVDAAKRAQVTQGAWSEYESGSHQPSLPLVRRLAAAVGVKPSDLLD